MNKKEHTAAVFLDMEKAFDKVWHSGLLYKLIELKMPRRIVNTIDSFLQERKFQVKVEGVLSDISRIEAGVPQGSCLSPTLYAVYTDDIPTPEGVTLALYAEDAAYMTSSFKLHHAVTKMQRVMDVIPEWITKWRLAINIQKTQAVMISKNNALPSQQLMLQGQTIPWKKTAKYLGMQIDRRLSMALHVKGVVDRTRAARAILRPVMNSSLPLRMKMTLYKTYIRPHLTYAAPAWYALTAETQRRKLRQQQNAALREVANAPRFVRNATIARDLRAEDLDKFIKRLSRKMFNRADNSSHTHLSGMAPSHQRNPNTKAYPRELLEESGEEEEENKADNLRLVVSSN